MSACIDRKVLDSEQDVRNAFKLLDTNKDGTISLDDFEDLFQVGGAQVDKKVWENLLEEADKNEDGIVDFEEFQYAMKNMLTKSIHLKKRRNTKWMV